MRIPLYQVDAFADRPFTGNPAAVCPLDGWLPAETMQAIAAENNLSETAFFVAEGEGWRLRWFTPTIEVDLCGHATLAAAHVIFTALASERQRVLFHTEKAGDLAVTRDGELLALDFPAWPPEPCAAPPGLGAALGRQPVAVLAARDYLAVYDARATWPRSPRILRRWRGSTALRHRHRAGIGRNRFRLALFRAGDGRRRRPGHRLGALHADPVLGRTARQGPGFRRASCRAAAAALPASCAATGWRSPAGSFPISRARSKSDDCPRRQSAGRSPRARGRDHHATDRNRGPVLGHVPFAWAFWPPGRRWLRASRWFRT